MLAGRGDDRPPAPGRARLGQGDLGEAAIELARVVAGPDDVEREVLEHPDADAVARRCRAVGAAEEMVVDRLGGAREAIAMERAVDDGRDPPAGDRVLAQLEQPGGHRAQIPVSGAPRLAASAVANTTAARSTDAVVGWASAVAALGGDRGRGDAGHPARVDEVEVGEIDGDVERDPVVAHAALDAEPEGADLARVRAVGVAPAAGVAVAPAGGDAERGAGRHEGRLERADERPDHQAARSERDDRVGDQLARAVVGDLAAALDADDLDARVRPASRHRRGCAPGPTSGRGSGRAGARAAAAGRRSARRRARPRGASGGPVRRGSRRVRAMTRRSAPGLGSTRCAREPASRSPRGAR